MGNQPMDRDIETLSLEEARTFFCDLTGVSAPRALSLKLLKRAIFWHVQCLQYHVPRRQADLVSSSSLATRIGAIAPGARPGSILLREWRGRVYEVRRTKDDRYVCGEKTFASLSAVATFITGCRRSGPRFFGLAAGEEAGL
jgi:hypothetical protein